MYQQARQKQHLSTLWGIGLIFIMISANLLAHPQKIPKIVGGQAATSGAYPWMAALLTKTALNDFENHFCGGSLIHPDWILTAAHCMAGETPGGIEILLGRENLNGSGGERIGVSQIIVHPDYVALDTGIDLGSDLALLKLSQSSSQSPIVLLEPDSGFTNSGSLATVIGWGLTANEGNPSASLLEVTLPIVSNLSCNQFYEGGIVENTMICAGLTDSGKDSCQGDSGGPLFVEVSPASWQQAGVVSFGDNCGSSIGVYARVSSQKDWIQTTLGKDLLAVSNQQNPTAGVLESPFAGSSESGIGLVRGWVCQASKIEMSINDKPRKQVPYGGSRGDTNLICGDVNNGFGTIINYNLIGTGSHNLKIYVDGVIFADVNFTVQTLGVDFLTGATGSYTLSDFPSAGTNVLIQWSEPHQNFIINGQVK